jgi:hypothetical protein
MFKVLVGVANSGGEVPGAVSGVIVRFGSP